MTRKTLVKTNYIVFRIQNTTDELTKILEIFVKLVRVRSVLNFNLERKHVPWGRFNILGCTSLGLVVLV